MLKSYGKIDDYSAVGNIERNEEDTKEEYDTKYSDEERKAGGSPGSREAL